MKMRQIFAFNSQTCHLLLKISYAMIWQEGRGTHVFIDARGCYGVAIWQLSYFSFQNINSRIFSSFSNNIKYLILENFNFTMKQGNFFFLLFPNYSRTLSNMHCYFSICNHTWCLGAWVQTEKTMTP